MANALGEKSALRWVHRWIALTLGVILTIVSLSGSLLLFQDHFFRWAHGELIPAGLSQEVANLDRWVANADAVVGPRARGPIAFWPPHYDHNVSDAGMLIYESGEEPVGFAKLAYTAVLVEPSNGNVLGIVDIDRSPAYAPLSMHSALWAGEVGTLLVAIMAIGALIMLPLGLYLWWPGRARLLQKLSPWPWRATSSHANRLHDVIGPWTVPVLFVLAATGLYMARDEWVDPVLTAVVGPEHGPVPEPSSCAGPIGYDEAVRRGRALVPSGRWVAAGPRDDDSMRHFEFTFKTGESVHQQVHVLADMRCGVVSVDSTPATRSPREATEHWLMTLHDGTALGSFGQILITVVGLAPLVLIWSGVRMWLRRRGWLAARAKAGAKTQSSEASAVQ